MVAVIGHALVQAKRLGHETATLLIEGEANRMRQHRLRRPDLRLDPGRHAEALERFLRLVGGFGDWGEDRRLGRQRRRQREDYCGERENKACAMTGHGKESLGKRKGRWRDSLSICRLMDTGQLTCLWRAGSVSDRSAANSGH